MMAHPRNPFPSCASNLILSSRHGCTISMNSNRPQEYKTALMPHLLKQQDYFIKLDRALNPQINLPQGHGTCGERKKTGFASKIYSSQNYLLLKLQSSPLKDIVNAPWRTNDEVWNELLTGTRAMSFTNYSSHLSYSNILQGDFKK